MRKKERDKGKREKRQRKRVDSEETGDPCVARYRRRAYTHTHTHRQTDGYAAANRTARYYAQSVERRLGPDDTPR